MSRTNPRLLVTGAQGFVGAILGRHVKSHYPDAMLVDINRAVDVTDRAAVDEMIAEARPTAVVHLAAISAPGDANADPRTAWHVNFVGTLNVAEAVRTHAPDARLVFAGSAEAYGQTFNDIQGPVSESAPLKPRGVYGATKAAADVALGQMRFAGLDVVRFRPFNHSGPGQTDKFVIPAFARQIAEIAKGKRQPIVEVGDLSPERDFLDVRDVVRAYATAALDETVPRSSEAVYNLCSGTPVRIEQILDDLVAFSGREIEVRVDPARLRPSDVPIVCGSASLASAELGWQPMIPLQQTLRDVYDYWLGLGDEGR